MACAVGANRGLPVGTHEAGLRHSIGLHRGRERGRYLRQYPRAPPLARSGRISIARARRRAACAIPLMADHGPTVGVDGAAELLRCGHERVLELARARVLLGTRIRREWVFLVDDVLDLIRIESRREAGCGSISGERPGGRILASTTVRALDKALERPTASRRRGGPARLKVVSGGKRSS